MSQITEHQRRQHISIRTPVFRDFQCEYFVSRFFANFHFRDLSPMYHQGIWSSWFHTEIYIVFVFFHRQLIRKYRAR
uniref:Uncharacterized protein n=1 Tax=Diadegma fenestrale ichnovirus TaxID=1428464 RepID=A0A075VSY0_9VIRU|nr:hypothetical protein A2.1 [Diadegma fenestrale ichnovirus]